MSVRKFTSTRFASLIVLLLIAFLSVKLSSQDSNEISPVPGFTPEEVMTLGEAMYRKGILPSGKPMTARVLRDIPVDGMMFSCQHCHMRSGLGTLEGRLITLPTNGKILFSPLPAGLVNPTNQAKETRFKKADRRPAYTDDTLATAIAFGMDSNNRELNWAMPRYDLEDREMIILINYLKNLSAEYSPGVTDTTLRFATVIAEGSSEEDRDAMIAPLQEYVRARNSDVRYRRTRAKTMFAEEMDLSYRELLLDRWELKGSPESWRSQLESFYKSEPVFAVLGGIAPGDWTPIHRFCEEHEVPCILPVTDFPVISETDWYTLYYSKGFYKEGEAAARYLARNVELPSDVPIHQVFRSDKEGTTLAKAFRETMIMLGQNPVSEEMLEDDDVITDAFWKELAVKYRDAIVMVWLENKDLPGIETLANVSQRPRMIFLSGGLLNEHLNNIHEDLRKITFVTYPWSLPDDQQQKLKTFESWMKLRKMPIRNSRISSQMYFLGVLMSEALMHMKRNFYRDYFLDVIDMMADQTQGVVFYPRLSLGQGQRYLSKGCYVVQLSEGEPPKVLKKSDWIIH